MVFFRLKNLHCLKIVVAADVSSFVVAIRRLGRRDRCRLR